MQTQIRSLERQLACQLAQVKLEPLVEDFVDRWMDANELGQPRPDMLELVQASSKPSSTASPKSAAATTAKPASAPPANSSAATPTTCATSSKETLARPSFPA